MPKLSKTPKTVRAYEFHGLQLEQRAGQYLADCPFCDGSERFSIQSETGLFKCWRSGCVINDANGKGTGGNATQFIRYLHKVSLEGTTKQDYEELSNERGYEDFMTPLEWQLAKSFITGRWLVPAYNSERAMTQLYDRRNVLYPTPFNESRSGIFGANLYDPSNQIVWLTEGPWDGMALWERLSKYKRDGDSFTRTSNREVCLLSEMSVLAIPGLGAVGAPLRSWTPLFNGKSTYIAFDNDHPRTNDRGAIIPSAGWEGTLRAINIFSESGDRPDEVQAVKWGEEGYDPDRLHNYDIRDLLCKRD